MTSSEALGRQEAYPMMLKMQRDLSNVFVDWFGGMPPRHFPPPWSLEDNGAAFIVRDHSGQAGLHLLRGRSWAVELL
jgi:hypothetical protein